MGEGIMKERGFQNQVSEGVLCGLSSVWQVAMTKSLLTVRVEACKHVE